MMKIQSKVLCLISFFAFVLFIPSPLLAVSSGTCTVKDDTDDAATLFTLRNRVEHGANLTSNQTCQNLIKFEAGETFHIVLQDTLTFKNSNGLVIDGAGATVTIDEGNLSPDKCLFRIQNSDMHFKNMKINAPQHLIGKIFCDEGWDNHHTNGEEGLVIISKDPSECGNGKVEEGEQCDDNDDCCNSCHFANEGSSCSGAPHGECNDHGKCESPPHYCGDGHKDSGEECDDNDGCCNQNTCKFKSEGTSCNDGSIFTTNDQCNDQGKCSGEPIQISYCGDGHIDMGEVCDDGNSANGDGCSSACQVEAGWDCTTANPSVCTLIPPNYSCGNAIREPGEECDDGNVQNGDGCSAACEEESGYVCTGSTPSVCGPVWQNPVCGDGVVSSATGEQCDNNNECCQNCLMVPENFPCNGASGDRCDSHGECKPSNLVNPGQSPPPTVGEGCSLSLGNHSSLSLWALGSGLMIIILARFRDRGRRKGFKKLG